MPRNTINPGHTRSTLLLVPWTSYTWTTHPPAIRGPQNMAKTLFKVAHLQVQRCSHRGKVGMAWGCLLLEHRVGGATKARRAQCQVWCEKCEWSGQWHRRGTAGHIDTVGGHWVRLSIPVPRLRRIRLPGQGIAQPA